MNPWAFAADVLVFVHLCYVLFTVGGAVLILLGGAVGWKWVRRRAFRLVHLGAVLLVALEASLGVLCPLTVWEYALRTRAGQVHDADLSFVARIIRSIIFVDLPDWAFTAMYVGFGVLVLAMLLLVRPDPPRRRKSAGGDDGGEEGREA